MRQTKEVIATAYFPVKVYPIKGKDISPMNGRKVKVELDDNIELSFYVTHKNYSRLITEATGELVYPNSVFDGLSISWYSGKFSSHKYPHGVGTLGNPILPLRDFAHSSWPFGSKMIVKNCQAPSRVWYRGDDFGQEQPDNRVDLYTPEKRDLYRPMKIEVEFPKEIRKTRSGVIKLVQAKLNEILGCRLVIDGIEGPNTLGAVEDFNLITSKSYLSACDAELFFEIQT